MRIKQIGAALAAAAVLAGPVAPARAASRIVPLDLSAGQQPENIALEPDGSADLTFAYTGEIGRVSPRGQVDVIARIPVPADGDVPVVHRKLFLGGIVRTPGGDLYVAVSTGTPATGLYRVRPGTAPVRVAALPPAGFQNGVARDPASGDVFVADSFGSVARRVSPRTGRVTDWATGELLAPVSGFGANGVKVHDGALWVSNLDRGTLVRFPLTGAPRPGRRFGSRTGRRLRVPRRGRRRGGEPGEPGRHRRPRRHPDHLVHFRRPGQPDLGCRPR